MTTHETILRELARLQAENKHLRGRVKWLRQSRDHWRDQARAWKYGALNNGKGTTQ